MTIADVDAGPNLLLDWHPEQDLGQRWIRAGVGSIAVHILLFLGAVGVGRLEAPGPPDATTVESNIRKATPLYLPRDLLTQKAPNRDKVSKELNVEGLMASKAQKAQQAPPGQPFHPPTEPEKRAPEPPAPRVVEPPKIETAANNPPPAGGGLPPQTTPKAPPPQIQPEEKAKGEEKPKLAFQAPQPYTQGPRPANSRVATPGTTVDDAMRHVIRGQDLEPPPNIPGTVQMEAPRLELKSDPMGVDFRPYLIRVLATVRQKWFAVIPQSARMGSRGVTQLQLIIDKNGQVPKLVIADTSGSDVLDRAAVASVSAALPFPPLPREFRGQEIRVQFAFKYNVK